MFLPSFSSNPSHKTPYYEWRAKDYLPLPGGIDSFKGKLALVSLYINDIVDIYIDFTMNTQLSQINQYVFIVVFLN